MATVRVIYDLIARDHASRTFADASTASGKLGTALGKVVKITAAAGAGLTVAAGAVAVEATKMAAGFQASMEKIHTQAGASQKAVDALTGSVLKLGGYAEQSPQQLADALFHLKSVGLDNAKAMKALKTAADLAAVGGANLEDTTNALAGAWRSGIKGAQSFGKTAATVNAIIGSGNMRMSDFVDALSTGILPAARTFGVSLKSVGAALALMTDEGVPAQLAATRLRMTLSLMGAPSKKAAGELATIGLSSTALAKAMRSPGGLVAAISLLKDHLDKSGLSATQAAQLLSRAFGGGRSSSAIMTMINNLEVMRKKQHQINASVNKFGGDVKAQRKTAQAQFALLKSTLDVMSIKLGVKLLPLVTEFVRFIGNTAIPDISKFGSALLHKFVPVDALKRAFKTAQSTVSDFFAGLRGPQSHLTRIPHSAHAEMLTAQIPKSTAAKLGATLRKAFTGGIKAVNWSKIGSTIGHGLGTAFQWLTTHGAQIAKSLVDALAKLDWVNIGKDVGGNAIGFALGFIGSLGNDLFSPSFWKKHWWDVIMAAIGVFGVGKFGDAIGKILEHIPILKVFAPLFRGLEKISDPIWSKAWDLVKALGRGFLDGFAKVFPETGRALGKWLELLPTRLGVTALEVLGKAKTLAEGIGRGIIKGAEGLGRIIGTVIGWLVKPFAHAGEWLIGHGRDAIDGLISGIGRRIGSVGREAGSVISRLTAPFGRAGKWLLHAGGEVIMGLLHGIEAKLTGIGNWILRNVVDPVINAVKHWFGIHSPSTVMSGIGGNLIEGLIHGLASHDPLTIARKVFGGLPAALEALVSKGVATVASLPSRAWKALGGAGSWLLHLFGGGGGSSSSVVKLGQSMAAAMGWTGSQWSALYKLWQRESGWNPKATNPSSGAYGIPQALPASKLATAGADWRTNPATQIKWGLAYILGRYRDPVAAWAHETKFGWYKTGAWRVPETGPAVVHKDEMVLPQKVASAVRSALTGGASRGPLVNIQEAHFHDEADLSLLLHKVDFAVVSAGLGG